MRPRGSFAHRGTVAVVALLAAAVVQPRLDARQPRAAKPKSAELLARFFAPDTKPLMQYRALRTLNATSRGGKMHASMTAWTSYDAEHGFQFEVVSEEGSSLIRRKVLLAALEAERDAVTTGQRDEAALTVANYEFLDMSTTPANLVKVDVKPKRKAVMLVDGSLFLEADSADLVKIEGELARRPSFWTRNVKVLREYARVSGVHVPVAMSSTADVLFAGPSSFSMTYKYVEINGTSVEPKDFPTLEFPADPFTHPVTQPTIWGPVAH